MKKYLFAFIALIAASAALFCGHAEAASHFSPEHLLLIGVVINEASLEAAKTGFNTVFQNSLNGTPTPLRDRLAMVVKSTTAMEAYKWLGQFPGLREWIGDRVVKDLDVEGFIIRNRDFENTVSVDRNAFQDDQLGLYSTQFAGLGEAAAIFPDQALGDLLRTVFEAKGYDGVAFCHTLHPNGKLAKWSNKGNKKLSAASYKAARAAMLSLTNDEGRSLRVMPNLLMVSPDNETAANELVRAEKSAGGATNVYYNQADVLVVPELAAHPEWWFLASTSRVVKPLIYQERQAPQFTALDKPTDANVFFKKQFIYGVDLRGNAGFGLPQLLWGSTGEVA